MYANLQSLHFSYFEATSMGKTKKNWRGGVFIHGNKQNRNQVACLSFRVDPLNWQTFIENGEMACSATAWCSRGHTLK